MINYTLAFATSLDGFIARYAEDNPFEWTSKNDQDHLKNLINQHEWQVMGRKTHELNPNHARKRIVFSRQFEKVQLIKQDIPNQYYFNPDLNQWHEFEKICSTSVLILGGTKIHDFFLYANLIDKIFITVEPIYFKTGIPAFSYINFHDIIPFFIERGFSNNQKTINDKGTVLIELNKI